MAEEAQPRAPWRDKVERIIFESDTPAGKAFDVVLFALILASILVVSLETVTSLEPRFGRTFYVLEWVFTGIFFVEYLARLVTVREPLRYALSFFGLIDLLSVVPAPLSLVFPGAEHLLVVRAVRLLRIFRVLKLRSFLGEASILLTAIRMSGRKIFIFFFTVFVLVINLGTLMYLVEGPEYGYSDIPTSVYWAVVTLTTVGYGDISPQTPLGRLVSTVVMLTGYAILAVPTGIVTSELTRLTHWREVAVTCRRCGLEGHTPDSRYCRRCAEALPS